MQQNDVLNAAAGAWAVVAAIAAAALGYSVAAAGEFTIPTEPSILVVILGIVMTAIFWGERHG